MRLLISSVAITLCLAGACCCPGEEVRVTSPDGTIAVIVSDEAGLNYRVEVDGVPVVIRSRLGLVLDDDTTLGPGSTIARVARSHNNGSWQNPFGNFKASATPT